MSESSRQSLCLNGPIEVRRDVLVTFFYKALHTSSIDIPFCWCLVERPFNRWFVKQSRTRNHKVY